MLVRPVIVMHEHELVIWVEEPFYVARVSQPMLMRWKRAFGDSRPWFLSGCQSVAISTKLHTLIPQLGVCMHSSPFFRWLLDMADVAYNF